MEAKEPCIDCPNKVIDAYGYFCDVSCGERTAWLNYMAGIKEGIREVVEWIKEHQIGYEFSVISIPRFTYLTKLKEWGIEDVID